MSSAVLEWIIDRLKEDVIEAIECMKSWDADGRIVSFKDTEQVRVILEQLQAKSASGRDRDTVE